MSPPRRPRRRSQHRITPEVIDAFRARDLWRLHKALGLGFTDYSPLTQAEAGAYGHPPYQEPGDLII